MDITWHEQRPHEVGCGVTERVAALVCSIGLVGVSLAGMLLVALADMTVGGRLTFHNRVERDLLVPVKMVAPSHSIVNFMAVKRAVQPSAT